MTHSPGTPADRQPPSDQPVTVLLAAMAGALVLLMVVLVLVGAELTAPPLWMLAVVAVATAGAWAAAVLAPVPRTQLRDSPSAGALLPVVMVRASGLEAPAVLGLVLAFVSEPTNLTIYLLPALFSLAGMWLFARPGAVRARLSRARTS